MRSAGWIIALLLALAPATRALAIGRRQPQPQQPPRPNRYYQNAANAQAIYPRYYGQVHARNIQNIGVPPGDVGLRGNGFMLNPW